MTLVNRVPEGIQLLFGPELCLIQRAYTGTQASRDVASYGVIKS